MSNTIGLTPPPLGNVLVVDDNAANLRVLEGLLRNEGYRVRLAIDGELALSAVAAEAPDIILLDVRMPGMDGREVCRRLKADSATRDIPVIFISALQDLQEKLAAFQAGGVDYIVKPFHAEEVLSRLRTQMELLAARRAEKEFSARLEALVAERTEELEQANRYLAQQARWEQVLSELTKLALVSGSMDTFLPEALRLLNEQLEWRGPESHNLILLAPDDGAQDCFWVSTGPGPSSSAQRACQHTSIADCACFQRLQAGTYLVDAAESIPCDSLRCLGYPSLPSYWVPLHGPNRILGALVHFLPADRSKKPLSPHEDSFMGRLSEVLSLAITRCLADQKLARQATHDELTGLPNRRMFEQNLQAELARPTVVDNRGAVVFLDLDHFKHVNDALGHEVGDELMRQIGERLSRVCRHPMTLARWGGDEFLLMLPGQPGGEAGLRQRVMGLSETVREELTRPFEVRGNDIRLGFGLGVAFFPAEGVGVQELVKRADTAMYHAKRQGLNQISFFEPSMQADAENALALERDLRKGISNGEFVLYYQPQVDQDGVVIGIEALLRWPRPSGVMTPPDVFIPIAEETGLILRLGEWVLREGALSFAGLLQAEDISPEVRLSVNISPQQIHDPHFVAMVNRVLDETGLPPERLQFEVTENVLMNGLEQVVRVMDELTARGIQLSIDDFGTGYSSLSYLRRLPLYQLKIDKSFVIGLHENPNDAAIVASIINMATNLSLDTVAEGVETIQELVFLRDAGCSCFQGYLFSRPIPWQDVVPILRRGYIQVPGVGPLAD